MKDYYNEHIILQFAYQSYDSVYGIDLKKNLVRNKWERKIDGISFVNRFTKDDGENIN